MPPDDARTGRGAAAPFEEMSHLRIPGPTPVPPRVLRAAASPMINHRGKRFAAVLDRVTEGLRALFATDGQIFALTASGTAAMEAAIVNLLQPGERTVVLVGGKFGQRWLQLARTYRLDVVPYEYAWDGAADPAELERLIRAKVGVRAVLATQNESSTGVLNDIQALADVCRRSGTLLVVDAISGLGGSPLRMDAWGVGAVVSGSQKCLMLPPGLSFIAIGRGAWGRVAHCEQPRFYFDLRRYERAAEEGQTPFTPNVSLYLALVEALALLEAEGLQASFRRHALLRDMVRTGVRALGLAPFTADRSASPTVTAVRTPAGIDVETFRRSVKERFGVELAGGQGELKGQIFRIGHMGYAGPLDMIAALSAIEMGLLQAEFSFELGAGVAAAQKVWAGWA